MRVHAGTVEQRFSLRLRVAAGGYAALVGVSALVGWGLDLPRLTDWNDRGVSMQPNTAVAAVLAGLALLALSRAPRLAAGLGALVALFGAATMLQHLAGVDLGFDRLLDFERSWGAGATVAPGRAGPPAAISYFLGGIALVLAVVGEGRSRRAVSGIGIVIAALGAFSLLGHLFRAERFYSIAALSAISLQTSTTLLALALGLVAAVPEHQPMRRLLEPTGAGTLARRLLPILLLLPPLLGWLRTRGEELGYYDTGTGRTLLVLALVVFTTALFWSALGVLARHEAAERRYERSVVDTLESFTDSFYRLDASWRFLFLNRNAIERLGRTDLVGTLFWEASPGALSEETSRELRRAMRERVVVEYERYSPSEERWFWNKVYPTDDGGLAIYSHESTERKRAESALREKEVELERVTANTPVLLTRVSRDLRYVFVNQACAEFFGRSRAELQGATVESVVGPQALAALKPQIDRVLAGERVAFETEVPYSHAGSRYMDIRYVPDVDESGEIQGWFASVQDITARRRAEEALREVDRRKDDFLATLSHELRNPLAPVRSAVRILAVEHHDAADQRRAREVIERQTYHLTRLIDDLFDVSRINRGKFELRRERVELARVIGDAVEASRPAIALHHHELVTDLPREPIHLDADPVRLAQVVSNLLHNAAKYSDHGGRIELAVERRGTEAVISVRDAGIGISAEMLPRVFDPFSQGENARERTRGGLGIGLSLVRELVRLHGGAVEARSQGEGKGSEFVVTLPVAHRAIAVTASSTSVPIQPAAAPRRILVVDDNRDAADSLATLLRLFGNVVETAHDGVAALERVSSFEPEVVLLDLGLPGKTGIEVAREIRASRGAGPLLVAVTGWGQEEDRRRTSEAGFDFHMTKPIDPDFLRTLLATPASEPSGSGRA